MSPLFDRPPIDAVSVSNTLFSSGTFRITGGPGITVGSDASGATMSAGNVGSFFENAVQQGSAQQGLAAVNADTNLAGGRLLVQPLSPANELFPFHMTVTEANLNFSGSSNTNTTAASAAYTSSFFLGFYTRVNSTQLSLLNSASRAVTAGAATAGTSLRHGPRYVSFHSSIFSSQPVFAEGSRYWFAQLIRTSGAIYTSIPLQQFGQFHQLSVQRSGELGVNVSSGTSYNAWYPFMGVHSLTTYSALPVSLAHSDINKASSLANFIPHLQFNGGLAPVE
jgi:hypothetical protein